MFGGEARSVEGGPLGPEGDSGAKSDDSAQSKMELEKAFNVLPFSLTARESDASKSQLRLDEIKQNINARNRILGQGSGLAALLSEERPGR